MGPGIVYPKGEAISKTKKVARAASAFRVDGVVAKDELSRENCFIVLGRNSIKRIEASVCDIEYGRRRVLIRSRHTVPVAFK